MAVETRCKVCNKLYDDCKCAEYAERDKERLHEAEMREKLVFSGDKVIDKLKVVLIVAILSGTLGAIIASIAKSISTISTM